MSYADDMADEKRDDDIYGTDIVTWGRLEGEARGIFTQEMVDAARVPGVYVVTQEQVNEARDRVNAMEEGYLPIGVGEVFLSMLGIVIVPSEQEPDLGRCLVCLEDDCEGGCIP